MLMIDAYHLSYSGSLGREIASSSLDNIAKPHPVREGKDKLQTNKQLCWKHKSSLAKGYIWLLGFSL